MNRRTFRIINIVFWITVWVVVVVWTETWGHWFQMFIQSFVPVMLGGYLHLVLRPTGTSVE
jgi:hypothetical protein